MKILALLMLSTIVHPGESAPNISSEGPLVEISCSMMLSSGEADADFVDVPGLTVLSPPASQPQLNVELDPDVSLDGVVCWRSRAEIGPNDDWVARTGVPLYIKEEGDRADGSVLVLELTEVGYRVRLVSGSELSKEQTERTVSLIESFNLRRNNGT